MSVLPVVVRELLVQSRRRSTYWIRAAASAVAGFLMLWLLVVGSGPSGMINQGKTLFFILSVTAFVYCLFIGALLTADCLSSEKRDGTIGLLFLTDLKGYDLVLGKLFSSSLHAIYGLLAIVPMISLALFFGGVTGSAVLRMILVLHNTLFLSLAVGIFVSTFSKNERRAVFAALLFLLLVSVVPYELGYVLAGNLARGTAFEINEDYLLPSPIYAFYLAQKTTLTPAKLAELYSSVGVTHAIGWLLIGAASFAVPRVCRERPKEESRARRSAIWRRWRFGSDARRLGLRHRLLDKNACLWLSARDRQKQGSVWVLVLPLVIIAGWVYFQYRSVFAETAFFLIVVVHVLLKVWFAGEVSNRWIEDRRSGALELTLCTPLKTHEIVGGQTMALLRQFGGPVLLTTFLTYMAWLGMAHAPPASSQLSKDWALMNVPVLIADLTALRWVGMWRGLTARSLNRAIVGTVGRVLCLRWIFYYLLGGVANILVWVGFYHLKYISQPFGWLTLALTLDLIFGMSARRRFMESFRTVASIPTEFKGGNADRILTRLANATPRPEVQESVESIPASANTWPRWRRRCALAAGVLLVALIAIFAIFRIGLKRRFETRLEEMRQAGQPTNMDELYQSSPPFTNKVDAAAVINQATPFLPFLYAMPGNIQINLPERLGFPPFWEERLQEATKEAIRRLLSSNQMGLQIIHAAPSLGQGRYAQNWNSSTGMVPTQNQAFEAIVQALHYEVYYWGNEGQIERAVDSLVRLFQLARSVEQQGTWQSGYGGRMAFFRAFSSLQWLLNRSAIAEKDLARIKQELPSRLDVRAYLNSRLTGARCVLLEMFRRQRISTTMPGGITPSTLQNLLFQAQTRFNSLSGADMLAVLDTLNRIDSFARIDSLPMSSKFKAAQLQSQTVEFNNSTPFNERFLFESFMKPCLELETRSALANTAIAVERFRIRTSGQLPSNLEALVPTFLPELPIDPFNGEPLHFKSLPNGYCIYSLGPDLSDDGGFSESSTTAKKMRGQSSPDITFSILRKGTAVQSEK